MNGTDQVFSENEVFWLKDKVEPLIRCFPEGQQLSAADQLRDADEDLKK